MEGCPVSSYATAASHSRDCNEIADSSAERRTDEPAHPAIDTGHRRDAGAGHPGGTALRPESHERDRTPRWPTCRRPPTIFRATSMRKFRARPSFTMASPAPAISTHATRRPVRPSCPPCAKNITQFTGILTINPDGSLFCDSLRTDRTLDLRDRAYFKQALVAHGVVTLEPVFGRLTGISVLQIAYPVRAESGELKFILLASFNLKKFAEYHDKRLSNDSEILLVDRKGMVLVAPQGKDWTEPAGASIANSELFRFAAAPNREPLPRGDRTAMAEPMSGPSPARLRSAMPDFISWSDDPRTAWSPPPTAACTRIWRCSRWPRCCCSRAYGFWRP